MLAACSEDSSSAGNKIAASDENSEESSSSASVPTYGSLDVAPNCSANSEGNVVFIEEDLLAYTCLDGKWVPREASSSVNGSESEDVSSSSVKEVESDEVSSSSVKGSESEEISSSSVKGSESEDVSSSSVKEAESNEGSSSSSTIASSSSSSVRDDSKFDASTKTLTDYRDGKTYRTVTIKSQIWMAENLNYDYNVGTAQSSCYGDDPDNCEKYGRLYTWAAAIDSAMVFSDYGENYQNKTNCGERSFVIRGACPLGWHIPNFDEWLALFNAVNSIGNAGNAAAKLKSTNGWKENGNGTDNFGFSVLPAGYGVRILEGVDVYEKEGEETRFVIGECSFGFSRVDYEGFYKEYDQTYLFSDELNSRLSVRCIMD